MRNNRQPIPTGWNGDSPILHQILETMTELQRSNKEFRKQSKYRERKRKRLHWARASERRI